MRKHFILGIIMTLFCCVGASAQIFYRITGNGLDSPSYILGTHHLAPLSVLDNMDVQSALDACSAVVGEIEFEDELAMAAKMQRYMMAPPDSTLSKMLGADKMDEYSRKFAKIVNVPGFELKNFDMMRPMVASTILALFMVQELMPGFDPKQQLDSYFMKRGKQEGKKIIPLETVERQAEILYQATPVSIQLTSLCEVLDNPQQVRDNTDKLNKAYLRHDLDAMYRLSKESDGSNVFFDALLFGRNDVWMQKLPSIIQENPAFIVVGALHLAGEKGIVSQLRNLGYTVTPID